MQHCNKPKCSSATPRHIGKPPRFRKPNVTEGNRANCTHILLPGRGGVRSAGDALSRVSRGMRRWFDLEIKDVAQGVEAPSSGRSRSTKDAPESKVRSGERWCRHRFGSDRPLTPQPGKSPRSADEDGCHNLRQAQQAQHVPLWAGPLPAEACDASFASHSLTFAMT